MQEKLKLIKSQGASPPAEILRIQNIPYASAVRSIMYAGVYSYCVAVRYEHNKYDFIKNLEISGFLATLMVGYLTDAVTWKVSD
ncbi:hypothetical protein Tco_0458223 [Tanacetum coccineum]